MLSLTSIHLGKFSFCYTTTLTPSNLPLLTSFIVDEGALLKTTAVSLYSVRFINGTHTEGTNAFFSLPSTNVNSDAASLRLKNCIINSNCTSTVPSVKPTCRGALTISSDSQCSKINENYWTSITISNQCCQSYTTGISLVDNPCLTSFTSNGYSFQKSNFLVVKHNPLLQSMTFGAYSFYETSNLTLSSIF